jgi:cell wall-associated NlpC family hydrolase
VIGSKVAAAAAAVLVLFVVGISVLGGAPLASGERPPAGGCAVTPDTSTGSRTGTGAGTTGAMQKSAVLNANQMAAARAVAGAGAALRIAERGIAIALGTAMQESTMNPTAVNGRAVGLFQQQGALYATIDRTDPAAASRAFYEQLVARAAAYADARAGTFADIAQMVQRSGAGAGRYAVWERWATALAAHLVHGSSARSDDTPVTCEDGGGSGPIPVHRAGQDVTVPAAAGIDGAGGDVVVHFPSEPAAVAAAAGLSYLDTPYAWGGGGPNGPSQGIRDGGVADRHGDYRKVGFDCSGLTEYAYAQAGIAIGGDSRTQYASGGTRHPFIDALPGDLLFAGDTPATIHHVAIYLGEIFGRDYVLEAPESGDVVKVSMTSVVGEFRTEVVRPWK